MPEINEIFEEEDDNDEEIIQKYSKKIILRDLTWFDRFQIWIKTGIWVKKL